MTIVVSPVVPWRLHRWISERAGEIAYDQIGEADQEKLAQAVVFWPIRQQFNRHVPCVPGAFGQSRRVAMARIVTNALLFLFLVSGCRLSKEDVQTPKTSESTLALVGSNPVETAIDRTGPATITANTTVSKEDLRMLQARLKASGFYVGPIDGIIGPKTKSGLFRLQAACANLK